MTNLPIAEQKNKLRKEIRRRLKALTPEQIKSSSESLCNQVTRWLESHPHVRTLTSFAHLPSEPDLSALHELLPNYRIAYPHAAEGGQMGFHHVTNPTQMVAGYYGIRQPVPSNDTLIPVKEIDLVLCPAFAFTLSGERLGKGGGYYDRFLSQLRPDCHVLGIALECQILHSIPTEAHDVLVDQILTASPSRTDDR